MGEGQHLWSILDQETLEWLLRRLENLPRDAGAHSQSCGCTRARPGPATTARRTWEQCWSPLCWSGCTGTRWGSRSSTCKDRGTTLQFKQHGRRTNTDTCICLSTAEHSGCRIHCKYFHHYSLFLFDWFLLLHIMWTSAMQNLCISWKMNNNCALRSTSPPLWQTSLCVGLQFAVRWDIFLPPTIIRFPKI